MPRQSRYYWRDHSNNVWWGAQTIKLFVVKSSALPSYLVYLAQISSSAPYSPITSWKFHIIWTVHHNLLA
jgi:hypothetical protein